MKIILRIKFKKIKSFYFKVVNKIIGEQCSFILTPGNYPWLCPADDLQIRYKGQMINVGSVGVLEQRIIDNSGHEEKVGYSFVLDLEQLLLVTNKIRSKEELWNN
ncbi:hypothetical protein Mgra_00006421 [Meloidogyne graminicola]|uniref:Phenylalanyl-tRNA synthetase domain-containing protein n=1 Tax=Meloidogyne graminicola TaxID=189291 RepID=A0A8S9ZLK3_9BILA|nr:hypothetical protein Mgra_00006421 [Meloidogyne graminicola]